MQSWLTAPTTEWFAKSDDLERALVTQTISPHCPGRVYWRATYWSAQVSDQNEQLCACPETFVRVLGRRGITLLVSVM